MARRLLGWLLPVAVAGATLVAFGPVLEADFTNHDDVDNLLSIDDYRGLTGESLVWMLSTDHMGTYEPLAWLSHAVDDRLFGIDGPRHHLSGWLLHALSAVLLYRLLVVVLEGSGATARPLDVRLAAAFAATTFAAHPLRAEVVGWLSARGYALALPLCLAATLLHLRSIGARRAAGRWLSEGAALVAFAGATLSKPVAAGFPIALLALDVARSPERWRRRALGILPYLAVGLPVLAMGFRAKRNTTMLDLPLVERAALVAGSVCHYPLATVWPFGLSPTVYFEEGWTPWTAGSALALLAAIGLTVHLVRNRRRWPGLLAAWVAYLALLGPVSGIVQSGGQKVADRYAYLAGVPLAFVVGLAALDLIGRRRLRPIAAVGLATIAVALGVLSHRQAGVWRDSQTLWSHAVAVDPDDHVAHYKLGNLRLGAGDLDGALDSYSASIAAHHAWWPAYEGRAEVRRRLGNPAGAIEDLDLLIGRGYRRANVYYLRAIARRESGDRAGASDDLDRALERDPGHVDALNDRAGLRLQEGATEEGLADLDRALARRPDYWLALVNRAVALDQLGRRDEAVADLERARRNAPPASRADIDRRLEALGVD